MCQLPLFELSNIKKPVNVSSVPQRSPFRYPGGKTWLIPQIRRWMASYKIIPKYFFEPFAGGGIVGLTIAFEQLAEKVIIIELDENVASVWLTMLSDDSDWLVNKILNFNLTLESAECEINREVSSTRERAFKTILKNRIYHGGILAPGSGLIKYGEAGKGIHSRWYPETICKRIININQIRNRISFHQGDGIEFISCNLKQPDGVFFLDPPYTAGGKKAGSRLYTHFQIDHAKLFELANQFENNFLMTYDNSVEVLSFAEKYHFETKLIAMNNTHHAELSELLIGRNLNWVI